MALRLPGAPSNGGGEPVAGGYLLSPRATSLLLDRPGMTADPMAGLREQGGLVRVQDTDGCLPCHGGQDRLLEANRRMLEELRGDADPADHPTCEFQGAVSVHPTAVVEHTLVRGPAIIGPGSRVSHAYVGPYTAIGAGVTIDGSQIEHSIVLDRRRDPARRPAAGVQRARPRRAREPQLRPPDRDAPLGRRRRRGHRRLAATRTGRPVCGRPVGIRASGCGAAG